VKPPAPPAYISTYYSRSLRSGYTSGINVTRPAWYVVARTYRMLRKNGMCRAMARTVVDELVYAGTCARWSSLARYGQEHPRYQYPQ